MQEFGERPATGIMSLINRHQAGIYHSFRRWIKRQTSPTMLKEFQSRNDNLYDITNPDLGYDIGRVVAIKRH